MPHRPGATAGEQIHRGRRRSRAPGLDLLQRARSINTSPRRPINHCPRPRREQAQLAAARPPPRLARDARQINQPLPSPTTFIPLPILPFIPPTPLTPLSLISSEWHNFIFPPREIKAPVLKKFACVCLRACVFRLQFSLQVITLNTVRGPLCQCCSIKKQ